MGHILTLLKNNAVVNTASNWGKRLMTKKSVGILEVLEPSFYNNDHSMGQSVSLLQVAELRPSCSDAFRNQPNTIIIVTNKHSVCMASNEVTPRGVFIVQVGGQ